MAVSLGLALVAIAYVASLLVLVKTSGFRKKAGHPRSFLHFRDRPIPFEQGLIGLFSLLVGFTWLGLWVYFLYTGHESFRVKVDFLWPHVVLQLMTGVSLTFSGIATIVEWKRWQLSYILSLMLMVCSTLVSLIFYGPEGHGEPLSMRFLGIWSFCIVGLLTFGLFVLHRLLNRPGFFSPDSGRK